MRRAKHGSGPPAHIVGFEDPSEPGNGSPTHSSPKISGSSYALAGWNTNLYTSSCSSKFDTYMSDVEFSPDGSYFVVSTSGAHPPSRKTDFDRGRLQQARGNRTTQRVLVPQWGLREVGQSPIGT